MFIKGKLGLKTGGRHAIFWVLEVKRSKILQNWTKETAFVYILGFIFMAFLAQKLIYAIDIWFNFVFGSVFEQNHLLNLFISGVMRKHDLNVHVFQYKNWCSPNSDRWFFFSNFDCQRTFLSKKIWRYWVNLWKNGDFVRRT